MEPPAGDKMIQSASTKTEDTMANTRAQKIKNILNEIDKISHPPTKTISISEVEEEISKYKDGTLILISYQSNTTEAWESEDLSDFCYHEMTTPDSIKAGKSTELTKITEDLRIPKSTPVTFIPSESNQRTEKIRSLYKELQEICPINIAFDITPIQTHTEIRIEDPIIPILSDLKKMCNRKEQETLLAIQYKTHPRSKQETIEDTLTGIFRNWEKEGGYRDVISKVKGINDKNSIECDLIGETLRKELRTPAEKRRHNLTINDIKDFVRKVQELTPKDIKIKNEQCS